MRISRPPDSRDFKYPKIEQVKEDGKQKKDDGQQKNKKKKKKNEQVENIFSNLAESLNQEDDGSLF